MSTLERLLAETAFDDVTFSGLDAAGADLSGKEFCQCRFVGVKLPESRWRRARLEDCVFDGCDLTRMLPAGVTLLDVRFVRSKLLGVDWSDVSRDPGVSFEECDLRYSTFVRTGLRKAVLRGCLAVDATFLGCDLVEADFSGTTLTGASFEGSDLGKANLVTAEGAFVDPAKSRVKGARISVESAVLLATHHGMRVSGYSSEAGAKGPGRRRP